MFGRWAVSVTLGGLPAYPKDMAQRPPEDQWPTWQADMSLAIRGVSVVISEQQAAHWCPIQINDELSRHVDSPDDPVTAGVHLLAGPGAPVGGGPRARRRRSHRKGTAADCVTSCR